MLTFSVATAAPIRADVFRWDNGQLIQGTRGIAPGPDAQLDHRELAFANLGFRNLTGARFDFSNLTSASLTPSTLTNVNLSEAAVAGARFNNTTSRGFTKEQLESTASYRGLCIGGRAVRHPLRGDPKSVGSTSRGAVQYMRLPNSRR